MTVELPWGSGRGVAGSVAKQPWVMVLTSTQPVRDLDAYGTVLQTGLVRALTKAHPVKAGAAKPRVLASSATLDS